LRVHGLCVYAIHFIHILINNTIGICIRVFSSMQHWIKVSNKCLGYKRKSLPRSVPRGQRPRRPKIYQQRRPNSRISRSTTLTTPATTASLNTETALVRANWLETCVLNSTSYDKILKDNSRKQKWTPLWISPRQTIFRLHCTPGNTRAYHRSTYEQRNSPRIHLCVCIRPRSLLIH